LDKDFFINQLKKKKTRDNIYTEDGI